MVGEYSQEEGARLLKLARDSINEEFSGEKVKFPEGKKFMQARGVFVTLTKNSELRGCVGFPYPIKSVSEAAYEAAKSSAFSDFRFLKLDKSELEKIKIEISILSMPQETKPEDIKIGRDGLMCSYVGYSGLLLPQVAVEWKMSRLEFLEAVCQKAGLPKDSWQKKGFSLKRFSCQIFKEQ
ncbi:AmmeMemoRadiSam system protein A [Candidatus Pacearchaeota archaeon]|nr:AmmeMemoRadiSam system protein A [Candidatus Pacearchaeota archaeon]